MANRIASLAGESRGPAAAAAMLGDLGLELYPDKTRVPVFTP
jgi:hypothetical protein